MIGHQQDHLPGGFVQLALALGRWVVAVGDLLIGAAGIPECHPAAFHRDQGIRSFDPALLFGCLQPVIGFGQPRFLGLPFGVDTVQLPVHRIDIAMFRLGIGEAAVLPAARQTG